MDEDQFINKLYKVQPATIFQTINEKSNIIA